MAERLLEFVGDDPSHLLRLQIVGVVIGVRQHIRSDQDAAPRFRSEAFCARLLDHVVEIAVVRCAVAVTHAIETAQVRRALCRRDHVINRDAERGVRQRNVDQHGTLPDVLGKGFAYGCLDIRLQAFAEELLRHADAQTLCALAQVARVVLVRAIHAGRVLRVEAEHGIEDQRGVFRRAGHDAGLVQAGGERDHAPARCLPISWLDAGDSGKCRRFADRAAGIGRRCGGRDARGHRCGRSARTSAGHRGLVPRVQHVAVVAILVRRAHGKLVAVQFAEANHAGAAEVLDDRRVEGTHVAFEHARRSCGSEFAGDENILVRDRYSGQRGGGATRDACIGLECLLESDVRAHIEKGVQGPVAFNAVEVQLRGFDRRDLLGG